MLDFTKIELQLILTAIQHMEKYERRKLNNEWFVKTYPDKANRAIDKAAEYAKLIQKLLAKLE